MTTPTLCLIGAGRAGGSLARLWHRKGGYHIKGLYTRSGRPALAETLSAVDAQSLADLPASDALLIAADDSTISLIAEELAALPGQHWRGRVVFHLSGALPSSCLQSLADKGALIASAHPVHAFSSEHTAFNSTWVGIEGDSRALPQLNRAFDAIGGQCFTINGEQKAKYHAAAVIASNHMVALADAAQHLWRDAGVDSSTRTALFESLVLGVLGNLRQQAPSDALTGPIARGDTATVSKHLQVLGSDTEASAQLYRHLSLYLVGLMQATHSTQTNEELLKALAPKQP